MMIPIIVMSMSSIVRLSFPQLEFISRAVGSRRENFFSSVLLGE